MESARFDRIFADANQPIMEIVSIYPPYIYSVRYEENEDNEFDRLFEEWNDLEKILPFLEENAQYLKQDTWRGIPEPEDAARQVLEEARRLEGMFERMDETARLGKTPDYDGHFRCLNGSRYECLLEYIPMKSYGPLRPSLLRMYAIKLAKNTYLITGGGIKLGHSIQESPGLKDHALRQIDAVRAWLKREGVIDADDLNELND